ncbi:MAG: minor capsid protein [Cetobacterium sp.]
MFPHKEEKKLKYRINTVTEDIFKEIEKLQGTSKSQYKFDKAVEKKINQFIDELVDSTIEFAKFTKEEWEEVLKGTLPSPLNENDTEKWLLENIAIYKATPQTAVDKLDKTRYNRIEEFRKDLNSRYELSLDNATIKDIRYIEAQLKNTAFDFKEWDGLRTDIKNIDNFSKEDMEGLKKWFYRRNELWARNQAGNLYAMQNEEMAILTGVEKFKWVSEKDERVRKTHKALDGKILDFDSAEFLPGQEPLCRCHLEPIPNKDSTK